MQQDRRTFMLVFREGKSLSDHLKSEGKTVGFVPTMGALHEGHLHLVREASKRSDIVVVSVFVNPTQFNNPNDLKSYPRDEAGDSAKLESAGCDIVWFPTVAELYPNGPVANHYDLGSVEEGMEGTFRPGHFQGVATVVDILFNYVQPDYSFFGEKDYQQVAVVRKMVELRGHKVEIVPIPTVRENDGVAMSSRNLNLTEENRAKAKAIYRAFQYVKSEGKSLSVQDARTNAIAQIEAVGFEVEYVAIADANSLKEIGDWSESDHPRIFAAANAGSVRLIDNMSLK